jgi:hypothetical protein
MGVFCDSKEIRFALASASIPNQKALRSAVPSLAGCKPLPGYALPTAGAQTAGAAFRLCGEPSRDKHEAPHGHSDNRAFHSGPTAPTGCREGSERRERSAPNVSGAAAHDLRAQYAARGPFPYTLEYIRYDPCQGAKCEFAAKDVEGSNSMRCWNLSYRKIWDAESLAACKEPLARDFLRPAVVGSVLSYYHRIWTRPTFFRVRPTYGFFVPGCLLSVFQEIRFLGKGAWQWRPRSTIW